MPGGVILLDKEAGLSSAQAIARVKQRLKLHKIGHAGTLDPMATGLLVCLTEQATRLAPYAAGGNKTYSGTIQLGLTSDSDDITGAVLSRSDKLPAWEAVLTAAAGFHGEIEQVPPRISALKVHGKRAYRLAREGQEPDLAARKMRIFSFDISRNSDSLFSFKLVCEKGTYVRAIARDMGKQLGCGAVLASLRREASEPFSLAQARAEAELSAADILAPECLFPGMPRLELEHGVTQMLLRGDSKMLYSLGSELARFEQHGRALYFDRADGRAGGLLVLRPGGWTFGLNFSQ